MQKIIEMRAGELLAIPLSQLTASARNARKTGGSDVSDLKASIKAQGVLQNLIVCPAQTKKGKPTGKYEVVGGARRLRALSELAAEGEIASDEAILCCVKPTRDAAEASLAENVARMAMHPADEFDAFKRLVDEGMSIDEIAARFGTSELTVHRRMKLASVHPALLALYREDGIGLEQLMALAVSDDVEQQLRVWERSPAWQRDAASLRRVLVADGSTRSTIRSPSWSGSRPIKPQVARCGAICLPGRVAATCRTPSCCNGLRKRSCSKLQSGCAGKGGRGPTWRRA